MHRAQNLTPEAYVAKRQELSKRKSPRPLRSCQQCRTLKIACDRGRPCNGCVRQGTPNACVYHVRPRLRRDGVAASSSTDAAEPLRPPNPSISLSTGFSEATTQNTLRETTFDDRLARLERQVYSLATYVSPASQNVHARSHSRGTPSQARLKGILASKASGTIYYIGETAWTRARLEPRILFTWRERFERQWSMLRNVQRRFVSSQNNSNPTIFNQAQVNLGDARSDLLYLVPTRQSCEEVEAFWDRKDAVSLVWLARFLAVLAVGYQLPVGDLLSGSEALNGRQRGVLLMSRVEPLISSYSTSSRPNLMLFQVSLLAILSQSLALDWVDGTDVKTMMLSQARCMAFTMGLHCDTRLASGLSAETAELRRMLWTTFAFLDLEHAVQTGMPFLLSDLCLNIPEPGDNASSRMTYQTSLGRAMLTWGRIAQLIHSSNVPSANEYKEREDLDLAGIERAFSEADSDAEEIPSSIQQAVFECFNHRMVIVLNGLKDANPDLSTNSSLNETTLASALAILSHQKRLIALFDDISWSEGNAWAHFAFALLHCNFFLAANTILGLVLDGKIDEVLHFPEGGAGVEHQQVFEYLRSCNRFMERCVMLSPYCMREYVILNAEIQGTEKRLRLKVETNQLMRSSNTEEAQSVIREMQLAMDRCIENVKSSLDEAQGSDDPPPALCADHDMEMFNVADESHQGFQTRLSDPTRSSADPSHLTGFEDSHVMDDWDFDFNLFSSLESDFLVFDRT